MTSRTLLLCIGIGMAMSSLALGCSSRSAQDSSATEDAEPPQQLAEDAEGSGQASTQSANEPDAASGPSGDNGAAGEVPTQPTQQSAETQTPEEPLVIDIFEVMTEAGFERTEDVDLAEYLPIPPRSEGQVGRFSRNGTGVTVARITYPDPMFAEPHVNWIEERIALLPQSYEQYLVAGPTVIHINGESVGVAAAAHDAFEQLIAGEGHDQP